MANESAAEVTVFEDREALSLAAAGLFAEEARRAAASGTFFNALLSGGETPRRCYELLGAQPLAGSVPWHALHLFWGDERYVPLDDPASNFAMARAALLRHVPLADEQVHPVPFLATPRESAAAYEHEIRSHFASSTCRFDFAFLGLGDDGHTASLFPGSPALNESERLVCEVPPPGRGLRRITLTPQVLNASSLVVFLVSGSGKSEILKRVLEGAREPDRLPAQLIRPQRGRLVWMVDRDAARLLSQEAVLQR